MAQGKGAEVKPFIMWPGGKRRLLPNIIRRFPYAYDEEFTYVEPFVGGGAMFWWVMENCPNVRRAYINDVDKELIHIYRTVRDSADDLIEELDALFQDREKRIDKSPEATKEHYYAVRDRYNNGSYNGVSRAAALMFLMRTGFNGLYRRNRKGEYNVPSGLPDRPRTYSNERIRAASDVLNSEKVKILCGEYTGTTTTAGDRVLYYIDPPYIPKLGHSDYSIYSSGHLTEGGMIDIIKFIAEVEKAGAKWILSASDYELEDGAPMPVAHIEGSTVVDKVSSWYRISAAGKAQTRYEVIISRPSNGQGIASV